MTESTEYEHSNLRAEQISNLHREIVALCKSLFVLLADKPPTMHGFALDGYHITIECVEHQAMPFRVHSLEEWQRGQID